LKVLTLLRQPPPGVGHHEQNGSVISGFGAAGSLLAGKSLVQQLRDIHGADIPSAPRR
jgi:hypothetical protein